MKLIFNTKLILSTKLLWAIRQPSGSLVLMTISLAPLWVKPQLPTSSV